MTARHSLDQIERGLDGVTAGPWVIDGDPDRAYLVYTDDRTGSLLARLGGSGFEFVARSKAEIEATADAIREIAAYVRDLEERLAKAAEALEPFNQAALAIRTAERMNRREFQDGDTFVSGVAWKEDDKVRTITFGDFRRARTALTTIRRTEK